MIEVAHHDQLAPLDLRLVDDVAGGTLVGAPRQRQRLEVLRLGRGEEVLDGELRGRCARLVDAAAGSVVTGDSGQRDEDESGRTMHDDLRTCRGM